MVSQKSVPIPVYRIKSLDTHPTRLLYAITSATKQIFSALRTAPKCGKTFQQDIKFLSLVWVSFLPGKTKGSLLQEITMAFRILFDEVKLKQGIYEQENDRESEHNGVGWPKGTWFQKRLRQVREQQRRKLAETDFVYECALGTITIRQSNSGD
jgi:hypothetical protein